MENKKRLFVDIDGTLAVFQPVHTLEVLYEKGYFLNLEPIKNVLEAVKIIARERKDIQVAILSSVLSDSKYAWDEKNAWLDKYLPEVQERYFPHCGKDKRESVPGEITGKDFLLDDYTKNLFSWEPPARGVKLLNGINHTNETWQGSRLSAARTPRALANSILAVMDGQIIRDSKPMKSVRISKMRNQDMEP